MNIYFGDLHNHCNISYGFGSLENALREARNHLDFCTVTGHALWPDMYESNDDTAFVVDFHRKGFKKLESRWREVVNTTSDANEEGKFVTLQSYEMHSSKYGDHHILSPDTDLDLYKGNSPGEIVNGLEARAIAIPHHIAYSPGYRGISWDDFNTSVSPVVEVFSKHGCGVSDEAGGEYMHTMGPRDGRNSVYEGLRQGRKFGFAASTDHHAGYPGSFGDGITAVVADKLTRESIWEAILLRRVYALTGDRIRCLFTVNGHPMGSEIAPGEGQIIRLDVNSQDYIEKAVIYKNLRPVKAIYREDFYNLPEAEKYKVRIETGWGRKTTPFKWKNSVSVSDGSIEGVDPCFRGQSVLAPKEGEDHSDSVNDLGNKITTADDVCVHWECTTFKNPTPRHAGTNAIVIEIKGSLKTVLNVELNGKKITSSIGQLLEHGISGHMHSYNSEAWLIHKAVPEYAYNFTLECQSDSVSGDFFHAEVHQVNGQSVWISPVYIK